MKSAVRRAGLDYWKYVNLKVYENWDEFIAVEKPAADKMFLFSRFATKPLFEVKITKDSYLVFGSETKGLLKMLKINSNLS